jgi:glycosyltransferase involved in cell wall biosynthesis
MQRVLWLCSWYPNKLLPFEGDFIQRHAQAVSLYCKVHVMYAIRDTKGEITKNVKITEVDNGHLTETIIYYYSKSLIPGLFDKYLSYLKYKLVFKQAIKEYLRVNGKPDLIHVHTGMKSGLLAMWLSRKIKIPYVLSEHWAGFLPEAKPNLNDLSFAEQHLVSKIMNHAELVLPVSAYLGNEMKKRWPHIRFEVVPNVVNKEIFFPVEKRPSGILKLVHVSTLTWQKDPESLLNAIKVLKEKGIQLRLDVFGPPDKVQSLIKELDIADIIFLHGEVAQSKLAESIQQSDALILYSRYETFGCVIIEANACGVPVVVPDTNLMHELVDEGKNGILVPPGNFMALADAIESFSRNRFSFDQMRIARSADKYSYKAVGKKFWEIYNRLLAG